MTFYLIVDTKKPNDYIDLAEQSFDNLWCHDGWKYLLSLINKRDTESLSKTEIRTNENKTYTVVEFLDYIKEKKLNVIQ